MHLNLPVNIFVEADWTLLGNVIRANEDADDLRKIMLAALIHSGRKVWDLPVFWTAPLQEGMLDNDCESVLFYHLVDFARKMDFTKQDFHNAHTLFPELAYFSPSDEDLKEARVITQLMTTMRRHWQRSKEDRSLEQELGAGHLFNADAYCMN